MKSPANHLQLVANAKKLLAESNADLGASNPPDVISAFAKIGEYVPSEAERRQLEYLDRIHEEANAKVFDSRIRF